MNRQTILKFAKWLWVAAVIVAGGVYLATHWGNVSGYFATIAVQNLLLSALFLAAGKLILVFLSQEAVRGEGLDLGYAEIFRIVAISQLGKYIPGGVWHFVGRFNLYHDRELSARKSTKALIAENVWLLTGAVISGAAAGLLSPQAPELLARIGWRVGGWELAALGAGLLFAWLGLLVGFERFFRMKDEAQLAWGRVLRLMGVQAAVWVLLGVSFAFVFPQVSADTLLLNISVYALSWIVGYVVVFAPGGLGVREATLTWMLATVIAPEDALIYSTVHRFVYVVVELILGALAGGMQLLKKKG